MTNTVEAEAAARAKNNAALNDTSPGERESSWQLDVLNDAEYGRWIAVLGAEAIGALSYRFVGGRVVLLTAWVEPAYRRHRVATELIARVLDEIRDSGKKITVICPVVGEFIDRNPQYANLIDAVHPGAGAYPQHGPAKASPDAEIAALERDLTERPGNQRCK